MGRDVCGPVASTFLHWKWGICKTVGLQRGWGRSRAWGRRLWRGKMCPCFAHTPPLLSCPSNASRDICVGAGSIWEISAPSREFCCEPKKKKGYWKINFSISTYYFTHCNLVSMSYALQKLPAVIFLTPKTSVYFRLFPVLLLWRICQFCLLSPPQEPSKYVKNQWREIHFFSSFPNPWVPFLSLPTH